MLDMGWTEIMVIGVVALIVVGPKDLPRMLRTLGQYTGKLRGMAREFQRSMDDAAREADLDEFKDIKKSLNEVSEAQYEAQRNLSQSFLDGPSGDSKPKPAAAPVAETPAPSSVSETPPADPKPGPASTA